MNNIYKITILASLILSVGLSACKDEAKTPKKKIEATKIAAKQESPKPTPEPVVQKKLESVVENTPNHYFLIMASFQNQEYADRLQKKLTSEGYVSEIHSANNGFFRVSYKGFSDRKLAFQELSTARSTESSKDTWLYIKR